MKCDANLKTPIGLNRCSVCKTEWQSYRPHCFGRDKEAEFPTIILEHEKDYKPIQPTPERPINNEFDGDQVDLAYKLHH